MTLHENTSLVDKNTFRVPASARFFSTFSDASELEDLPVKNVPLLIVGGGSNLLFTKDFDGLVLKNEIMGIEELHEDPEYVYVRAGAGENWHSFVLFCLDKSWGGLENLSLIPGNVGAAPIQNIGAYGVELETLFWDLEAFDLTQKKIRTFTKTDCEFNYRDSVFKNRYKGQFIILNVTFRLRKKPIFHTSYGVIQQELDKMGIRALSIKAISQAVINIRSSKLPDPAQIGNAGSFFKNPTVPKDFFESLKIKFPGIVGYSNLNGSVKLAAAWLIEQCGPASSVSWKGYRVGDAGCHPKQALVLVNYGKATGAQVYDLSEKIRKSVKDRFTVDLEREVNII